MRTFAFPAPPWVVVTRGEGKRKVRGEAECPRAGHGQGGERPDFGGECLPAVDPHTPRRRRRRRVEQRQHGEDEAQLLVRQERVRSDVKRRHRN